MRYPLRIELRSSKRMIFLNAAIHLVAAFSFLRSSFPAAWIMLALAVLGWSFWRGLRHEEAKGLCALTLEDGGGLRLERLDGEARGQALGSSADFGWGLWLHWRGSGSGGRRGALMLLPDNLDESAWRGLRIWLRHKAGAAPDG